MRNNKAIAVAATLAAGCLWGSIGPFVRVLDGYGYGPLTIIFVRMLVAVVLLAPFFLLSGRSGLFKLKPRDIWCLVLAGFMSAIFLNVFYSISIVMNPLALASILLAAAPCFVVVISRFAFRESLSGNKLAALGIVFAGCVLTSGIIGSGGARAGVAFGFSPLGVLVGLVAGLGWAMYSIMTRICLNRGYHPLTVNFYTFFFGALLCLPFTNFGAIRASLETAPGFTPFFLLLHTLVCLLLPYMLYTYGLRYLETGDASIIASVDPVFAAFLGFFLYREAPDVPMFAGFVLVLAGIVLLNLPQRKPSK
jgi:drug/metabolite transporter (DMT)-like permease